MNKYDKIKNYISGSANQDFILAHLPVLSTYMPSTAPSFLFISFNLYFPDCSGDFDTAFYTLFGLSIGQTVSTICYFHISFYSENSPCWDRIGFFVHQFVLWTSHVVIPIAVNCVTYTSFKASNEGKTPYNILFICYSIICIISFIRIVYYFNRVVLGTWTWYKARHA